MDVSENSGTPKSSMLIGFSIIFTIDFGGVPPIFGSTPIWSKSAQIGMERVQSSTQTGNSTSMALSNESGLFSDVFSLEI